MALGIWPTVRNWLALERVPAALLNAQIRDALSCMGPIASGNVLSAASAAFQTLAIGFPAGRFTVAPIVIVTARTPADVVMQLSVSAETTTGANIHFKRATAVATNIGWFAYQPSP